MIEKLLLEELGQLETMTGVVLQAVIVVETTPVTYMMWFSQSVEVPYPSEGL